MPLSNFCTIIKACDNIYALQIWVAEAYSELFQTIKVGIFTKIVNGFSQRLKAIIHFCKKPHLRCLLGFLIRLWVSKLKGKMFSFSFQIICSVKAHMRAYVDQIVRVNKGANTLCQISRFIRLHLIFTLSWIGILFQLCPFQIGTLKITLFFVI